MDGIDPEIGWYYSKGREAARLSSSCRLEEARTRRILSRRLETPPQSVVDIGGGPGAYALWLAGLGHSVHLVDPVALHLEQARSAARDAEVRLAGFHETQAEELPFEDDTFDAALMLGPLYHLTERPRRVRALREAHRVLRPGGRLFAAAIGRYGSAIDGFFRGYVSDPAFAAAMQRTLEDGQHRNPGRRDRFFTTAYFHRPEELRGEVTEAGFPEVELVAIEGAWSCIPDLETRWEDERFRSLLLETIETMEADPSTIGFGGHVMAVARRPFPSIGRASPSDGLTSDETAGNAPEVVGRGVRSHALRVLFALALAWAFLQLGTMLLGERIGWLNPVPEGSRLHPVAEEWAGAIISIAAASVVVILLIRLAPRFLDVPPRVTSPKLWGSLLVTAALVGIALLLVSVVITVIVDPPGPHPDDVQYVPLVFWIAPWVTVALTPLASIPVAWWWTVRRARS